jgi:uncharacterized protein YbbC (DUF1343 family)
MAKFSCFLIFTAVMFGTGCHARDNSVSQSGSEVDEKHVTTTSSGKIRTGAEQDGKYLPLLQGKKVAVVGNQTSMVGNTHLVDHLLKNKINVVKVFAPEHGFRGEAGPGDKVQSGKDLRTGLPVISLYGSRRKPTSADLAGVEIVVFDIQDVGVRFYTYISTLHYVLEACADEEIPVMVLDRPNPNGFYIDGPVLETPYLSFVGIAPIPVVHGLTVGEYAKMAVGEKWIKTVKDCKLEVIPVENYTHSMLYELPVAPSPNLKNMESVYLYPTLCFFEGAKVSVGRGTDLPFQVMGFPGYSKGEIKFTPREIPGVIKDPPYEDEICEGKDLRGNVKDIMSEKRIRLEWIIEMYRAYPDTSKFFNSFFDKLAGTDKLRRQITQGLSAESIRATWKKELDHYRKLRERYLIYPD